MDTSAETFTDADLRAAYARTDLAHDGITYQQACQSEALMIGLRNIVRSTRRQVERTPASTLAHRALGAALPHQLTLEDL